MKIGVAITTHNRAEVTNTSLKRWRGLLPHGAVLIVVDDGSDVPYPEADFRFEKSVGIAKAKNKCLELLEDLGVTDYFLADNDVYPKKNGWWKPYVESPEPHLSYQFEDLVGPVKLHDMTELYRDDKHVAYSGQRGCLLYYKQVCLDRVGGFDPTYGRALYEHCDLANRIHHAGLTTWRYADVAESQKIWHSMDEYVQVTRTIPKPEQQELLGRNATVHSQRKAQRFEGFVPYRESVQGKRNIVLTTLLTANPDPQRGYKWKASAELLAPWLESMERGGWEGVVLADELSNLPRGYSQTIVNVPASTMNVYFQRWLHIYQYLRDNQDIKFVWCTDGTDVEVLRDPFKDMIPGKLYVGTEPSLVGTNWMKKNHQGSVYQKFLREYGTKQLLNAGVVGGERNDVMELAQKIVSIQFDLEADRFFRIDTPGKETGDMAAFNKIAYEVFGSRLVYGPEVTTGFKSYTDNGTARFKHK